MLNLLSDYDIVLLMAIITMLKKFDIRDDRSAKINWRHSIWKK